MSFLKRSVKIKIALFYRYLSRIGLIRGFVLFVSFHIVRKLWGVKVPMLKHPIFLRKWGSDITTFDQIFLTGIYKLPKDFQPKVIIDCGANVGMATVYFATRFPDAIILAIEPEESNFNILVLNCKPYPHVIPIRKAVWHTSGKLHIIDGGKGNYAFMVKESIDPSDKVVSSIDAVSISDLMNEYRFDEVGFVKMDIEGAEKFIFSENYDYWLSRTNALSIEIHESLQPGTSKVIVKAMAKHDFSIQGSFEGYLCFK